MELRRPNRSECRASGTLRAALHLSRLFGAAPARLPRRAARVSSLLYCADLLFITTLDAICLSAIVMDYQTTPALRVTIGDTPTFNGIRTADILSIMVSANIAAFFGRSRLKEIIYCLSRVQEIEKILRGSQPRARVWSERKKFTVLIFFLIFPLLFVVLDYGRMCQLQIAFGKSATVMALFVSYSFAFLMIFLLEMQFMFTALEVCEVLKALNNALERLIGQNSSIGPWKTFPETVHQLASGFSIICHVIRRLDSACAVGNVMLIVTSLAQNLATFYVFFILITLGIPTPAWHKMMIMGLSLSHVFRILLITEPAELTMDEIQRTHTVVSKLILGRGEERERRELAKFCKYLLLNQVRYEPLRLCTLSRSLVPSLLDTIATYLVVIIQLNEYKVPANTHDFT